MMDVRTRMAIWSHVTQEAAKNLAMMVPPIRKWRLRSLRSSRRFTEVTDADLSEYGFAALEMLLRYIPLSKISNATIVEIGPGDNVVTGIPLLALGASSYHAIDRFLGDVEGENARRLYARVTEELPKRFGLVKETVTDPCCFPRALVGSRVFLHCKGIEEYKSFKLSGEADLVFSHGVGQSVASPECFAQACVDLLKPRAVAIHRIHFGPTGCWLRHKNPLTFLTVNPRLWKLTASHRGSSNRVRFDQFLSIFLKLGLDVTPYILERFSGEQVDEIRPFLADPFKATPRESLEVRDADFVCIKPG